MVGDGVRARSGRAAPRKKGRARRPGSGCILFFFYRSRSAGSAPSTTAAHPPPTDSESPPVHLSSSETVAGSCLKRPRIRPPPNLSATNSILATSSLSPSPAQNTRTHTPPRVARTSMSAAALAALLGVGPEAAERAARVDLLSLLTAERCGPLFIRLAFNDAATFDGRDGTGGANGSVRTRKELSHAANAGLERAVHLLAPLKPKFPALSSADLFQLAGVVALEACGGPPIGFVPGRRDSWAYAPEGRLFAPPPPPPAGKPWLPSPWPPRTRWAGGGPPRWTAARAAPTCHPSPSHSPPGRPPEEVRPPPHSAMCISAPSLRGASRATPGCWPTPRRGCSSTSTPPRRPP